MLQLHGIIKMTTPLPEKLLYREKTTCHVVGYKISHCSGVMVNGESSKIHVAF